jgi:hypothetical protein
MKNVFKIFLLSLIIGQASNSFAQTNGTLTFSATTINQFGERQPKNIMAIWITNSSGTFVKTLKKMAGQRVQYLYQWKTNSSSNTTDAITGVTLPNHQTHTVTWNGKNTSQTVVQDGDYKVWVEFTDGNVQGPVSSFLWTKSTAAQTLTPTSPTLSGVSLTWTPNFTGVCDVENSNVNISVYPNPFNGQLNFVIENSNENCLVDIYDIAGKKVAYLTQLPTSLVKNIITWNGISENGDQLNNGIYFYSINIGTKKYSGKVLLSK